MLPIFWRLFLWGDFLDITLDDIKQFGKLEYDCDDEIIQLCLDSAVDMLTASGIPPIESKAFYKMTICRLALHYYEYREELSNFNKVPYGMDTMIEQLRNTIEE